MWLLVKKKERQKISAVQPEQSGLMPENTGKPLNKCPI
jgi:hypothetical protein